MFPFGNFEPNENSAHNTEFLALRKTLNIYIDRYWPDDLYRNLVPRASFSPSSYSEKMDWDQGWNFSATNFNSWTNLFGSFPAN